MTTSEQRKRRSLSLRLGPCVVLIAVGVLAAVAINAFAAHESDEWASDPEWMLTVTQDESSMEEKIEEFMEERTDETAETQELGEDDIQLVYTALSDDVPDLEVAVDTIPTNKDGSTVTERSIVVSFRHELPDDAKKPRTIAAAKDFINDFLFTNRFEPVPGRILINDDGDLLFITAVNIPGPRISLHAEVVYDMIVRSVGMWRKFWPEFEEEVLD